jgi:hypothetical protein
MERCLDGQAPTANPIHTPPDIELGELIPAEECTVCFSHIPPHSDRSYGCGNPKCNGRFCDECMAELAIRYIHTPHCCNCTEPCGAQYVNRLTNIQVVIFSYDGNHYMVTCDSRGDSRGGSPNTQFALITSPVIYSDLSNLRIAYKRATNIPEPQSLSQQRVFTRSAHNIRWLYDVDNVRWGKLSVTMQRYVTVNYHMICLMNGFVFIVMFGMMVVFGSFLADFSYVVDLVCMFVNSIVAISSYWLFVIQILYNDMNVFSKNVIHWRFTIFSIFIAVIFTNNILMLERTLGDSQNTHTLMYVANFMTHGCVAAWMKGLSSEV